MESLGTEWLLTTLRSIGDAVIATDLDRMVLFINPAASLLTGWPEEAAVGRPLPEILPLVDRVSGKPVERPALKAMREGRAVALPPETALITRDGRRIEIQDTCTPIRDPQGEITGSVIVFRDVSEREQARRDLHAANRHAASILESITDGFVALDGDWCITYANAEAERINGFRREDVLGKSHWELHPATLGTIVEREYRRCADDHVNVEFEYFHEPWNRWFAIKGYPGKDGGISVYFQDITARKKAALALKDSEQRYRMLAENVQHLFWTCLPDGNCDYLSRQWVEYTGIPEAEQLALNWLPKVIHPDDQQRALDIWMAAVADRGPYDLEYRIRRADGQFRWFKTRGTPIRDDAGAIVKWFGTCTDIQDTKQAEEALREADRLKDEFLAMLAHELRNPLASIANAANLMRMPKATEEHIEWSKEMVARQVKHLSRMIDDLLDVSRITRGKIELRKERIDASPVINSAVDAIRPQVEEKKQELAVSFLPGTLWCEADPTRLEQILINLLSNASRYTPANGRIWLTARHEGSLVTFSVRDNGIGIPPDKLDDMFQLFAQGDRSIARSEGGLGIGLTVVKRIAELHGGTATAASDGPGKGSEFTVSLPAIPLPPEMPEQNGPGRVGAARSSRILIVDDNVDTARGLARLLKLLGHEIATAFDGPQAIEAARTHRPDFVILDIGLPGMDGYQVAESLRQMPELREAVLIALTGYGQEEARARAVAAGFNHHLVKPVDYDVLVSLIAQPVE